MNRNEKTVAYHNDGSTIDFNDQKNYNQSQKKTQLVFNFGTPPKITITCARKSTRHSLPLRQIVCDVCCVPLYLYSETFIAAYLDVRAELPPLLCDIHLAEIEEEVQK